MTRCLSWWTRGEQYTFSFLDCSMTFNTASQSIFVAKPGRHGLHREITRWVENLLESWSVVQSSKLIHWRAGLLLRGIQTGWVNELTGTSQSSTKANAESCSWDGTTPHNSTGWHSPARRHLEKEDLRALVDNKMNKEERAASLCTDGTPGCTGKRIDSRLREVIFPLCLSLVRPHLECYV